MWPFPGTVSRWVDDALAALQGAEAVESAARIV
jgi:hypothetical protein